MGGRRAQVGTIIWRFAGDPEAVLNVVLSHEADMMEAVGAPERVARVESDSSLRAMSCQSAAHGFPGYSTRGSTAPRLGSSPLPDRAVRRALNQAVDPAAIARTVYQRAFTIALDAPAQPAARRTALDTLNADAPALFLVAPVNVAAVARRARGFTIDPHSWLSGLPAVRPGRTR